MKSNHANSVLLVNPRILLLEAIQNVFHFYLGLRDGDLISQTAKDHQLVIFTIELRARERERFPNFEFRKRAVQSKIPRQHSDHLERFVVQRNGAADDSGVSSVMPLP